jgi:hypothetical protein
MAKLKDRGNGNYQFWCPGCEGPHDIATVLEHARANRDGSRPVWKFNGNMEAPTFSPSVNYPNWCHFFVEAGKIRFLDDCHHALAGKTVEIPDWPRDEG